MKEIVTGTDLLPKGNIKVELFEAGKKAQEINDHNFISKGARDYMFKTAIRALFVKGRFKDGVDYAQLMGDLFRTLVLTDSENPEDPDNEWAVSGNVIGRAASAGSAVTGPLGGTYNTTESITTPERVKMVFDFGTHAANGTIKSVFFAADDNTYGVYGHNFASSLLPGTKFPYTTTGASVRKVLKRGDNIYLVVDKNSKLYVEIFDLSYVHQKTVTLPTYDSVFDAIVVDDHVYIVSASNVKKVNLNDPTTSTTLLTAPSNIYYGGITYVDSMSAFLLAGSDYRTNDVITYMIDLPTFTVQQTMPSAFKLSYTDLQTNIVNGVTVFGKVHQASLEAMYDRQIVGSNTSLRGSIDGNLVIQGPTAGSPLWVVPAIQIGSRSLLATPITKNNTQTMKITYEFILE